MKCDYGCDQEAQYMLGKKWCCSNNWRRCPAVRQKNSLGLKKAYSEGRGRFDYNNMSIESKKRMAKFYYYQNLSWDEIGDTFKRQRIIQEQNHKCLICNLNEWLDKPIALEVDHIDGNNSNWVRDNVRAICPNCHAQTDTYRGRNKNSGTFKVEDSILIEALTTQPSIRQALLKCGLAAKGGNYDRAKRLLATIE